LGVLSSPGGGQAGGQLTVFLCIAALEVNVPICRDPRFGLSQITWRTGVAHHPAEGM
jgi:hypothetical protein